jgi:hypothetical protein
MKIILTKDQLITIKEQVNIQYTPERIDQYVREAENLLKSGTDILRKYYHNVMSTTIGEISEHIGESKGLVNQLKKTKDALSEKSEFYFGIVRRYDDNDEYPDNVKRLDDISTEIDYLQMDIDEIKDAFDCLTSSAEYLIKITNKDKL